MILKMPVRISLLFAPVILLLSMPGAARAVPDDESCKQRIVQTLAGLDLLPAHEETRTTVTETKEDANAPFKIVSSKKSIVLRVPPDRFSIIIWKNGDLRAESRSIGSRTWDRESDGDWKLELPAKPGTPGFYIENVAARVESFGKELLSSIDTTVCHGPVDFGGRKARFFTYRFFLSDAHLWVDAQTGAPIEERVVSGAKALRARSTVTRRFRYDASLLVDEPKVSGAR
jgi:hypothetical protein